MVSDKTIVACTVAVCVTTIEGIALSCGYDGALLTVVVGGLLLLAGVTLPQPGFLKSVRGEKGAKGVKGDKGDRGDVGG